MTLNDPVDGSVNPRTVNFLSGVAQATPDVTGQFIRAVLNAVKAILEGRSGEESKTDESAQRAVEDGGTVESIHDLHGIAFSSEERAQEFVRVVEDAIPGAENTLGIERVTVKGKFGGEFFRIRDKGFSDAVKKENFAIEVLSDLLATETGLVLFQDVAAEIVRPFGGARTGVVYPLEVDSCRAG